MKDLTPFISVVILFLLLFRNFFSEGFLVYPDFFQIFGAVSGFKALPLYLSSWSFGAMGSINITSLPDYVILGLLSDLGIVGVITEIFTIFFFLSISCIALYFIIKRVTNNPWIISFLEVLYFLTPTLFIEIFNGSADFTFYAMAPAFFLLSLDSIIYRKLSSMIYLGILLGFGVFWNPYAIIFIIPLLLTMLIISLLNSRSFRNIFTSFAFTVFPMVLAVLLNFPYFMSYFTSPSTLGNSLATISNTQGSFMLLTYQWATPLRSLTLLAASLFPRYSLFYSPLMNNLLYILPFGALLGFILPSTGQWHRTLKGTSAILIILSYSLIELGHYGLIELLFNRIPILYVDNYPDSFSILLNLGYSIIISLSFVSIFQNGIKSKTRAITKDPKKLKLRATKLFMSLLPMLVIVLLLLPANSYLTDGNFNLSSISQNTGFPPQWSPIAPASYYEIYQYLQVHNGLYNERPLILPYPGFNGGQEFRGFDPFLFDTENSSILNASTYINLERNPSAYYSTVVVNDLVNNSTNMIGIPLGYASVKYIIVDKSLNFTSLPTWYFGSMTGNPIYFMRILKNQSDLNLIFDNSTFAVFLNENFRPYVQQYTSSSVIAYNQGNVGRNLNLGISLNYSSIKEWTIGSAYASVKYNVSLNSFILNNTKLGFYKISFYNNTGSGDVNVMEIGGNTPLYMESNRLTASNLVYDFTINISTPVPVPDNTFVTLAGFNGSGNLIWLKPYYPNNNQPSNTITAAFNPDVINASTRSFSIIISLPESNGNQTTEETFSNLFVRVTPPSQPNVALLPVLMYDVMGNSSFNQTFPYLISSKNISTASVSIPKVASLIEINTNTNCSISNSPTKNYLYILSNYYGSKVPLNLQIAKTPSGIGGYSVVSDSNSTAKILHLTNYKFTNQVAIYAKGRGAISVTLENLNKYINMSYYINTSTFNWYKAKLLNGSYYVSSIRLNGSLFLNSVMISLLNESSTRNNDSPVNTASNYSNTYSSFKFYLNDNTTYVFLSQSYSNLWFLSIHNETINPMIGIVFGNLFIVNSENALYNQTVSIEIRGQSLRYIEISIQGIAWTIIAVYGIQRTAKRIKKYKEMKFQNSNNVQ